MKTLRVAANLPPDWLYLDGATLLKQFGQERITREQATRLCTNNNAYLTFEEKEKGSLEKGKLADFIVLNKDILTCPVDEVKSIEVERTYLGGKLIYQASRP